VTWALTLLLALGLLTVDLGRAPAGPTIDELSIGHNAWHLAEGGTGEHGERWPLYFRAFYWGDVGEYKNPVYIYALAPLEAWLGPADWVLRLPAVLFALLLAGCFGLLLRELQAGGVLELPPGWGRPLQAGATLAMVTTPWCFHFGRIALEGITFPALLTAALLLTLRGRRTGSAALLALAGLCWGLTLYSYSTARLLVPLLLVALLLTNLRWILRQPSRALVFAAAVGLAALPLLFYLVEHQGALTAKFYHHTLCRPVPADFEAYRDCLARPAVKETLFERYGDYLGFRFLFREGDPNPLHGMPGFGMLPLYWVPFVGLGLVAAARRPRHWLSWFVVLGWLLSPLAAIQMREPLHAIRSFAALPFLGLLALLGVGLAARAIGAAGKRDPQEASAPGPLAAPARAVAVGLAAVAVAESGIYVAAYLERYPRILYQRHPHVALAEAVRRGIRARRAGGHLYLPPALAKRAPGARRGRLQGHVSVFWRYYLRVPGGWDRLNAREHGVFGGPPPPSAPPGSVLVRRARRAQRGRIREGPCPPPGDGFAAVSVVRDPGPGPRTSRWCVYRLEEGSGRR
jgi:4-amino-4-deoxy-L-arabinose transferase-like glycosyltransferase